MLEESFDGRHVSQKFFLFVTMPSYINNNGVDNGINVKRLYLFEKFLNKKVTVDNYAA